MQTKQVQVILVMAEASLLDIWVPGLPATFATRGEAPWRQTLAAEVPAAPERITLSGLIMDFGVKGKQSGVHAVDLDNLCEPVISIMVNGRGWFGRRRSNIQWFRASKTYGTETGVRIRLVAGPPEPPIGLSPPVCLSGMYAGPLPKSARDESFSSWMAMRAAPSASGERYAALLQFGGTSINIGDVATGRVKNVIDCFYPVLRGKQGAPEDWRIYRLQVEKNNPQVPAGSVRVTIWPL